MFDPGPATVGELSRPFELGGQEVVVSASIGIAVAPSDGCDVDTLLRNADTAMYHAKDKGRENYQFYSESMNAKAMINLRLENSLRASLARGDLVLHAQLGASAADFRKQLEYRPAARIGLGWDSLANAQPSAHSRVAD